MSSMLVAVNIGNTHSLQKGRRGFLAFPTREYFIREKPSQWIFTRIDLFQALKLEKIEKVSKV